MTVEKETPSLKTRAYENLRYRIITQELPPGELLKEKELMARYGIGRTPLREILIELDRQGLIRRVPRSGTWVAPLDLGFVQQIAEVRVPLERLAGELAAARAGREQVLQMQKVLETADDCRVRENTELAELIQYESRFHQILYAATQNAKLEALLIEFQAISSRLWHNLFFTQEHLRRMFDDQRVILEALKARDGRWCGELLVRHTQAYFGRINGLRSMAGAGAQPASNQKDNPS